MESTIGKKIVIPVKILSSQALVEKLRLMGAEVYEDRPSPDELKERIKDAAIMTANNTISVTPEMIDAAPNLKYIIVTATGYDGVDLDYASKRGIRVLNCPTHNNQAVAEFAIALLLAANRQIIPANAKLRAGEWDDESFRGAEIAGKTLGLVGYGHIGKRIAQLATGLGMAVQFVNSKSSEHELDELFSSSDFVCICAPLNDQTRHLIKTRQLELLKPDAILINVARGAIIDQPALIRLLKAGRVRAALDVFEGETKAGPLSPEIMELANLPNVLTTPHIAYNTAESLQRLDEEILANIKSCLDGQPINVVNE